jgi:hypothetical protein
MKISEYVARFSNTAFWNAIKLSDHFVVIVTINNLEKTFRESFIYEPVQFASPVFLCFLFRLIKVLFLFSSLFFVRLSLSNTKTCSTIGEIF